MSELAYNINGEGFELPETATGWRVRRMKPRGAPEVVYGKDGLPLTIPIESDLEELRNSVDTAGRFRLDAVDDRGRNVDGAQPAYVVVASKGSTATALDVIPAARVETAESAIMEAMRLNTELAKRVIDRFPEMMTAAAELLRAADGAGLPARAPRTLELEDEADDDDDDIDEVIVPSSPAFDLINSLVAQVVPMIMTSMAGKKLPKLAAVLDWRKAQPSTDAETKEPATAEETEETELPPLDPKMMGHLIAVQSALAPAEAALARQLVAELSPSETRAWMQELGALSIPAAIAKVRSILGSTKAGGAS